jgi:hypothetical protein
MGFKSVCHELRDPLSKPLANAVFDANSFRDEIHARDADVWRPLDEALSRAARSASRSR